MRTGGSLLPRTQVAHASQGSSVWIVADDGIGCCGARNGIRIGAWGWMSCFASARWSEVGGRLLPGTHVILCSLRSSVGIGMTKVDCIAGTFTGIAAAAVVAGAVRWHGDDGRLCLSNWIETEKKGLSLSQNSCIWFDVVKSKKEWCSWSRERERSSLTEELAP